MLPRHLTAILASSFIEIFLLFLDGNYKKQIQISIVIEAYNETLIGLVGTEQLCHLICIIL